MLLIYLLLFACAGEAQNSLCDITLYHPTPNAILAGETIEFNLTLHPLVPSPLNLSLSFNRSQDLLLIQSFIKTSTAVYFVLHNFPSGHHHLSFYCLSPTSDLFLAASRTVLTLPAPLSPNPWWHGFTHANTEYIASIRALLDGVVPPPLSFERKADFIGARFEQPAASPRTLVAMFGSWDSQVFVDQNMRRFPESMFTIMLFVYDDSEWGHFPWASKVTIVRAIGQMKWWFIKRFLTPDAVQEGGVYDYVMILDADVTLSDCDPASFIEVLRSFDVWLAQPSHSPLSQTTHHQLFQHDHIQVGEWTNFVESGPVLAFSLKIWNCIWHLLQSDLVVGFGYDMAWGPICAHNHTAVIHAYAIQHENAKEASSRQNWMASSAAEGLVFFSRIAAQGYLPQDPRAVRPFALLDQCQS